MIVVFPRTAIAFAWETYKKRQWLFTGAAALVALAYIATEFLSTVLDAPVCGLSAKSCWISDFVAFVISTPIDMGITAACLAAHDNPRTFRLGALWHPQRFWRFLATSIIVYLICAAGFALFVIPGVLAAVLFVFSGFLVIDRGLGPFQAMKESIRLTTGHFWPLLVLCLVLFLLVLLGALALGLGLLIAGPVVGIALAHVYRFLSSEEVQKQQAASRHRRSQVTPAGRRSQVPVKLRSTPLGRFVDPATHRRGVWRPLVGVMVIFLTHIAGVVALAAVATIAIASISGEAGRDQLDNLLDDGTVAGTLFILVTFIPVWIGVWLAGRMLHKQPFGTFFAPDARLKGSLFAKGFLFAVVPSAVFVPVAILLWPDSIRMGLPAAQVALLFFPIAVLVFFQATAEELLFRGYLLQQLAWRFPHWIVWAVLPSIVFGLLHYDPDGPLGFYYVASTFLAGLIFCALVWRSGSLWAAIGCHFGINLVALTIMGLDGLSSGTELLVLKVSDVTPIVLLDWASSLLLLLFILSPAGRVFEAKPEPAYRPSRCSGPSGIGAAPKPVP